MFTGLVQAIGHLERCAGGVRIRADLSAFGSVALGDSIAVDGVCLTVADLLPGAAGGWGGFRADVSEETLARTALAERASRGGAVNLEPALRLADRIGGHLVSGHVDGTGKVLAIRREAGSWHLELAWADPALGRYISDKASVAVDGISLTVAGWAEAGRRFWIAVIPHTWSRTTLQQRRVGERVNLEADLLARYTERLLAERLLPAQQKQTPAALNADWLADHGWG